MGYHKRTGICPTCGKAILVGSTFCDQHKKSGRAPQSYMCSEWCQAIHAHCKRCGLLCDGSHSARMIEGLCWDWRHPAFSCFAMKATIYQIQCLSCTRTATAAYRVPMKCWRPLCGGYVEVVDVFTPPQAA